MQHEGEPFGRVACLAGWTAAELTATTRRIPWFRIAAAMFSIPWL
ncbi:hypothetical protein UG55_100734 [Frankia sp. EI5c]|nr:hypothetical protein [Frankia sp. EI5c]OAA27706.1 hypothetical protein UG55_100734 [Frankia sp. EI5c]